MKVIIHASSHVQWQGRYARHAQQGLKRHNIDATITRSPIPIKCDVAIIMGPNMYQAVERSPSPYLMFNRKFVGNDPQTVHENCAISWNGFNGKGTFCVDQVDPKRLEKYIDLSEIDEWNTQGDHVLLCEQSNVGRSMRFRSLPQFYTYVQRNCDSPIVVRKKPVGEQAISYDKFKQEVQGAKALISLNSTVSIDALMAGIPVITLDEGDPAYAITSHEPNQITYPDRLPFFQYLAHCQWTETEIANGDFWAQLYPMHGPKLYEWKANG